jgi:uncharacterized protein (TIGR02145 family)
MSYLTSNGKKLLTNGLFLSRTKNIIEDTIGIKYGRLYNHYVTTESSSHGGLISGFTVPTNANFYNDLAVYIRNTYSIAFDEEAIALRSTRTEPTLHPRWVTGNIATDQFNFSSLPGGRRLDDGTFEKIGEWGYWWNEERISTEGWYTTHSYIDPYPMGSYDSKKYGYSIRLIRPYTGSASDGDIIEQVNDYENNIYNVVKIGNYAWTIENLKTRYYVDGTPIPKITNILDWNTTNTGAYCNYNNFEE